MRLNYSQTKEGFYKVQENGKTFLMEFSDFSILYKHIRRSSGMFYTEGSNEVLNWYNNLILLDRKRIKVTGIENKIDFYPD
jgi:hypothetical protein